ncbi:E3 ubiquitin-protein ligase MARCHF2-like [Neodiprion fabricii]|uniref:E3 ubiquitin-protein ligase MARCHF2-like n=1 Tax=Neodiprion fabricii TaxID=2872261 RepID=UPI001ED8D557|nr:E3 ubiquitin-protein ligase MARCHF2-like [Neodiprion fabricii]
MSNIEEEQELLDQNDTDHAASCIAEKTISCSDPRQSEKSRKVHPQLVSTPVQREEFLWRSNEEGRQSKTRQKSFDQKQEDDASGSSLQGDICRICHMGGFPQLAHTQPMWEWQNQGVRRVSSQISTLSSYAYLGPLIAACKCRGTVGLVHAECLERWLTESGHMRCELCGHKYVIKRVPRHGILASVGIWLKTVVATQQMFLDIMYLLVTTPLALFSCYVCALALRVLIEGGFYQIPWMIIAMLPTCSLTLIAYWGWLITLGRLHSRRWRRFWRNNFVVRLLPDNALSRLNHADNYPSAGPPVPIVVNVVEEPATAGIPEDNDEVEEYNASDDQA